PRTPVPLVGAVAGGIAGAYARQFSGDRVTSPSNTATLGYSGGVTLTHNQIAKQEVMMTRVTPQTQGFSFRRSRSAKWLSEKASLPTVANPVGNLANSTSICRNAT